MIVATLVSVMRLVSPPFARNLELPGKSITPENLEIVDYALIFGVRGRILNVRKKRYELLLLLHRKIINKVRKRFCVLASIRCYRVLKVARCVRLIVSIPAQGD